MAAEREDDRNKKGEGGGSHGPSSVQQAGQFMGHGLTLAFATLFFLWLGWLLDSRLGSAPLFMILGAFVGAAAGFYNLYRHLVIDQRKEEDGRQ